MSPADTTATASFTIATPGNWYDIRLPQGEAAADELAAQLAGSWPDGDRPEEELRGLTRSLVSAATALDVLCAYATVLSSGGHWLPASLVVNAFPRRGHTLSQITEQLSGADGTLAPLTPRSVDLPAGPAVRVEQLREWGGSADGRHPTSLVVQYVAEVPGDGQALVLTFSTPALGMAEELQSLFHSIACTLRFEGQEPER
jgi:hypothetical protein